MTEPSSWPWAVELVLGPYPSDERDRLLQALAPEAGSDVPRTRVTLRAVDDGTIHLGLQAGSTAVLRAALNAYLRWAELAGHVEKLARARGPGRLPSV